MKTGAGKMKVLVVNNILIGNGSGTGNATENTLRNMFEDLEDVQILQYSMAPEEETYDCGLPYISTTVCHHNRLINSLLAYARREKKHNSKNSNLLYKVCDRVASYCAFLIEIAPLWVPSKDFKRIKDFAPEVIYTLGADIRLFRSCLSLSRKLNIPIVVHNMDDFYNMKYLGSNPLRRYAMNKLRKLYKAAYTRSAKSIAIGPMMRDEYEKEFSISFDWLMNCVSLPEEMGIATVHQVQRIIFSGGLHGGRYATLLDIAKVLESTNIELEVYTGNMDYDLYQSAFSGFRQTKLHQYVPREEMITNLRRADVLLHVESFDERYMRYFRLSLSTKIPEYLLAGKPVLCVGDETISTVRFVRDTGIGIVINTPEEMHAAIEKLNMPSVQEELHTNANRVLCEYYDSRKVHKKLRDILAHNIAHSMCGK